MGIFALSTLLVAGAGIYIFSKVFPNFQPGNKKIQADLKKMREEMRPDTDGLVPFSSRDLELLSAKEEDRKVKKRFTTQIKGKLSTIFHEPVAYYAYKHYLSSSGKDALLFVKTARHDYYYWIKAKGAKVVIDDRLIGTLDPGGRLLSGKQQQEVARIIRQEKEYQPLIVFGKEVANLARYAGVEQKKGPSERAFGYVADKLDPHEEAILLSITFYEMIVVRQEKP